MESLTASVFGGPELPIFIPTRTAEDWKQFLAQPDKQWKKGYSARTFAYCWQEANGFPGSVKTVLNEASNSLFHDLELLMGIPEYQVDLPGGERPSQNDLFVLAKGQNQFVVMMVEGKVKETFGPTLNEWLVDASEGKKTRLKAIAEELQLDEEKLKQSNVRYQLLHRTMSTVLEAKRFNAPTGIMMVHSFGGTQENFEDYQRFGELFGADLKPDSVAFARNIGGLNLYLSWVNGEKEWLNK